MSTPRPHRVTRGTPSSASIAAVALDGASVSDAPAWMRPRILRTNGTVAVRPLRRANPATSVWKTATEGMPSLPAAVMARPPSRNGLAAWSTSAPEAARIVSSTGWGRATGNWRYATAGTRWTSKER